MLINDIAVLLQNERKAKEKRIKLEEKFAWRRMRLFLATPIRSIPVSSFRFFVKVYYEMMWEGDGADWNDSNIFYCF